MGAVPHQRQAHGRRLGERAANVDVEFAHFAYWVRLPGLSHARVRETLHLVATEVVPAVSRAIAARTGA